MSTMTDHGRQQKQRLILVVEDSDEDYAAFLRALGKLPISYPVHRCLDGDECLDYLKQNVTSAAADVLRPSLILLDLNLPGTDGREVLEHLDADPALRSIPVVVVTTSTNPQDVELCYRQGANSYIAKSRDWDRFEATVHMLLSYWFTAVILPEESTNYP